jgi:hydroxymethylglutaryl-CoA synthase
MKAGIVGFGFALPHGKVTFETLAAHQGQDPSLFAGLKIETRTFAPPEENTATLCVRAGHMAIANSGIEKKDIVYCLLGSETPLYSVNPTSSLVGHFLGIPKSAQMFDLEFACKSGTAAMSLLVDIFEHKKEGLGLVLAGDIGSGKNQDALFYTAGSGAASFVIGNSETNKTLATIEHQTTWNTHKMDFWRGKTAEHPEHAGRWSGETFCETIETNMKQILEKSGMKIEDFDHVVLHMPNGKLPAQVAKKMKITRAQLKHGWVVETLGNTYSACVPLGLCNVLANSKPNQMILVVSYGSGAGSDAFVLKTTEHIATQKNLSVLATAAKLPMLTAQDVAGAAMNI